MPEQVCYNKLMLNVDLSAAPVTSIERLPAIEAAFAHFGINEAMTSQVSALHLSQLIHEIKGTLKGKQLTFVCGPNNKSIRLLACLRLLTNSGARLNLVLTSGDDKFPSLAKQELKVIRQEKVNLFYYAKYGHDRVHKLLENSDMCIESILATEQLPYNSVTEIVNLINLSAVDTLAFSSPSGFTPSEEDLPYCVSANYTMFAGIVWSELSERSGKSYAGELYLADIGLPEELLKQLEIKAQPIFRENQLLKIDIY